MSSYVFSVLQVTNHHNNRTSFLQLLISCAQMATF